MVTSGKEYKGEAKKQISVNPNNIPTTSSVLINDIKALKRSTQQRKQQQYLMQKLTQLKEQEAQYTAFNRHKLQVKWRDILRKMKSKQLKGEIEVLAMHHERQVDAKDAQIQMMWRDLADAEEQYRLALRTHQMHVDELIRLQEKRVSEMENEFRRGLHELKLYFDDEMAYIQQMHDEQLTEIQDIIKEMDKREQKTDKELEKEFAVQSKAITSKYKNDYHVMKIDMEELAELKRKQYQEENEEFGRPIYQSYRDFEDLRRDNDKYEEEIKTQMAKIRRDEEHLSQWKRTWLANQREAEKRNQLLISEIKVLKTHFNTVKKQMQQFRDAENAKLTDVVKMSKQTADVLNERLEQAQRIISASQLNRKHESMVERTQGLGEEDEFVGDVDDAHNTSNVSAEDSKSFASEFHQLSKFYSKFNKVLLDKTALEQEKEHLLEDNNKLRAMLKAYLDGISVNEEVLSNNNPLLIVEQISGQAPSVEAIRQGR